jgi:hypothetical protein
MNIESCFIMSMHVIYCAPRVGILDDDVIGCMVLYIILVVEVLPLFDYVCYA